MTRNLIDYYLEILERLENIENATKEMVFTLLNIDDKTKLIQLTKMTDEELTEALR